jgi:hypothetical protein
MFVAACLFLAGAATAVWLAQYTSTPVASWISIGYSAGAVLCTMIALLLPAESR